MKSLLRKHIWQKASKIEASAIPNWGGGYIPLLQKGKQTFRTPCQVLLENQVVLDRVYLVDCRPIGRLLFDLDQEYVIAAEKVVGIWESSKRLSPSITAEIAQMHEQKMGGHVWFELMLNTGMAFTWHPFHDTDESKDMALNTDFPDLPSPFTVADVVGVRHTELSGIRMPHISAYVCQYLGID